MKILATVLILLGLGMSMDLPEDEFINWSSNDRIVWDDFQGTPDESSEMLAYTYSAIGYGYVCRDGKIHAEVDCQFDVTASWVKMEQASAELLEHERGHFDITEIYARKMRKMFAETEGICHMSDAAVEQLADKIYDGWSKAQVKYDEETNHSKIRDKQEEWNEKISTKLKELETYIRID